MCAVAPKLQAWPTVSAGTDSSRGRGPWRGLGCRKQRQESLGGLPVPLDLDRAVVQRAPVPQHCGERRGVGRDLRVGALGGASNNVELAATNTRPEPVLAEHYLDVRVLAVGNRSIEHRLERD